MSDRRTLRVGLTQWHATSDPARNTVHARTAVARAAADGADLVLLPENGLMLGTGGEMRERAFTADSAEIMELREAARETGTVVVLGGMKHRRSDRVSNSALVIDRDGAVLGSYDKIHLFDATVDGRSFEASGVERAGSEPLLLEVNGVTVGITICYDVRFPELYRSLARAGAEVLLVPAAFTRTTGGAHWEVLLRSRAIENGAFVVASATVHGEPPGGDAFETYGHAMAVAPWGEIIADLGEAAFAHRVVDLDLGEVAKARAALPVLKQVRADAYARTPARLSAGAARRTEPNQEPAR
ncbi:Deaminated glutathione amidase [Streptomyces sp. RB17]|uniref:nitrilase-related carbon-nitrogen hydrolase n=1 Tax=Streptomyces sp. RB17 TaxID=2585197 RepID=UPI001296D6EE|nr:nitrilase-related carbon-nitrogen hydrolase [Streptomyces sp. RB17]MQY33836.1 Deaminated glutathione amidase [Streptomyces sp. RB17]